MYPRVLATHPQLTSITSATTYIHLDPGRNTQYWLRHKLA